MQWYTVQCSAVQYSILQWSTVLCSEIQYYAVQFSTLQCSAVLCSSCELEPVTVSHGTGLPALPSPPGLPTSGNVKNPGYGRHWISRPIRRLGPKPSWTKKLSFQISNGGRGEEGRTNERPRNFVLSYFCVRKIYVLFSGECFEFPRFWVTAFPIIQNWCLEEIS